MHKIARQKPACANVGPDPTRPADGPDPSPTLRWMRRRRVLGWCCSPTYGTWCWVTPASSCSSTSRPARSADYRATSRETSDSCSTRTTTTATPTTSPGLRRRLQPSSQPRTTTRRRTCHGWCLDWTTGCRWSCSLAAECSIKTPARSASSSLAVSWQGARGVQSPFPWFF